MQVGATPLTAPGSRNVEFRDFYVRELPIQVRRACLLVRSTESANDVVHDAMIEVFKRWDDLREPGAFLNRAVVNRCRDLARRNATHLRLVDKLVNRSAPAGMQEPLDDIVDRLPFNQRAAIVLRFYADLSIADIATALDCPSGSVGPWIDRALKTLKGHLE
jgi:RNA polymerase sigma factor (sigma-70 family)